MKRGPKSKSAEFHVLHGSFRRDRHGAADGARQPVGQPIKPKFVTGRAAKIWAEYVERAVWLTAVESHLLAAWCCLTAEFERDPDRMNAARISQWRSLASELGLTASSRVRLGQDRDKPKGGKDPSAEFFTD